MSLVTDTWWQESAAVMNHVYQLGMKCSSIYGHDTNQHVWSQQSGISKASRFTHDFVIHRSRFGWAKVWRGELTWLTLKLCLWVLGIVVATNRVILVWSCTMACSSQVPNVSGSAIKVKPGVDIWNPNVSVEQLLEGEVKGRLLLDKLFELYQVRLTVQGGFWTICESSINQPVNPSSSLISHHISITIKLSWTAMAMGWFSDLWQCDSDIHKIHYRLMPRLGQQMTQ